MKNIILIGSILVGSSFSWGAEGTKSRSHGAHEHGAGKLNLVLEGSVLELELEIPAHDVVGFESKPKSPKQKETVTKAFKKLSDISSIVSLPETAGCGVETKTISGAVFEGLESGAKTGDHSDHSDVDLSYGLKCKNPESLKELRLTFFESFPGAQKLQVQTVVNGKQGSADLNKKSAKIPGF